MTSSGIVRRAYVDVDGLQIHYRTAGEPGSPTLLLLHQSPSHSAMYEALMQRMASRFQLFAPDTPGFGSSDALPDLGREVEIADYARYLHGFCEALGLLSVLLFGHHTGAAIAVQMEHDFPGLAKAIALSGPTLLSEEQKQALPEMASEFPLRADGSHLHSMWLRLRAKDPEAPLELSLRELSSAFACGQSYAASYLAVTRQNFADQLKSIHCPTLVFAGDEDPLYHSVQPTMERLPNGFTRALPGGERTYVCERQAPWVADTLTQFYSNPENA